MTIENAINLIFLHFPYIFMSENWENVHKISEIIYTNSCNVQLGVYHLTDPFKHVKLEETAKR